MFIFDLSALPKMIINIYHNISWRAPWNQRYSEYFMFSSFTINIMLAFACESLCKQRAFLWTLEPNLCWIVFLHNCILWSTQLFELLIVTACRCQSFSCLSVYHICLIIDFISRNIKPNTDRLNNFFVKVFWTLNDFERILAAFKSTTLTFLQWMSVDAFPKNCFSIQAAHIT